MPKRVLALQRGHGLDGVRPADGLRGRLGQAEVAHLPLRDQVLHRARHLLDRHVGVHAVLVEEINGVDPQPLERRLGDLLDVLGPAVQPGPAGSAVGVELEPELRGDHDLPAEGRKRLADELFVREGAVDLGGVEEGHAPFDRGPDHLDHLAAVRRRAVRKAHPHAAESHGRNLETALAQFAPLHVCLRRIGERTSFRGASVQAGSFQLPIRRATAGSVWEKNRLSALSSAAIRAISSSVRRKSKTEKFSTIRSL